MYSIYWRAESRSEANSKQESGDNKHAEICLMSDVCRFKLCIDTEIKIQRYKDKREGEAN